MGLFYKNKGKNNKIIYIENNQEKVLRPWQKIKGVKIAFVGNNNVVKIHKGSFKNFRINITSNNSNILIKNNAQIVNTLITIYGEEGQYFEWGKNSTTTDLRVELTESKSSAIVGDNCMFSMNCQIRATDGHTILDKQTGNVINSITSPIIIGNHCWIGEGVRFIKNSKISDNTVVGISSIVTKQFEKENVILAGTPAKIIKENIDWDIDNPTSFQKRRNNG